MQSLGIRITGLSLVFLQAVLTARLLGPAGYGTVAAILSIVQVLATIGMLGFGPLAVREIAARQAAGEQDRIAGFVRLSFSLVVAVSGVLALLTAFVFVPALGAATSTGEGLAFAGILVIPVALLALLRGWAQGFGRIANAQIPAEVLRPAVMVTILLFALATGTAFAEREYMLIAIGSGILAILASLAMLWRSDLHTLPWPGKKLGLRDTSQTALPFLLLGIAAILQGEINTLLLALLASPEETGLFQPIARIAPLLVLPVQAAGMRYAPRMAELWQKGELERIASITRTFTWTTTALTLLIGLVIALAGPWLLLAFGEEFVSVAPLLWIIAAVQVFNAACGPVAMILTMTDNARWALFGTLMGLATNLVFGFIFIPTSGSFGAVLALSSGIVIWNILMLGAVVRTIGFRTSILAIWK